MRKSAAVLLAGLFFGAAAQAQTQPAPCGSGMPDSIYKAYVRTAQLELNLHGYDAGMPDGNATAKTGQAVRDYQRDAKLAEDGCVTKGLVDHLQFVLPKVKKPLATRSKPLVVEAQTLLSRRGYYVGAVDGVDGGRTRAAARRFLADAKAPGTGAVDQALVDSLKSADPAIRGDVAAPQ